MTSKNTMSRTYTTTESARACAEFGAVRLVYTDTVHADGRVAWSVKGTSDGVYVNESGVRQAECAIDFARIDAARLSQGWQVVA